ncbi:MAG: SusC/RagA family TonB-linked outer membrane protein [Chitinophagaceae bacterium]|nr:SusC/RagA family TonB-linked outer membrane protein [Chitinophagaceae bacterium]
MKLTIFFLLAACLQVGASGYAQRITISLTNVSLDKIFKEIERQSEYHFFYKDRLLRQAESVSVNVRNVSVEEALDQCFKERPLTYTILDKTIVVKAKKLSAMTALSLTEAANTPLMIIRGVVKDAQGNPLADVSVTVKGTSRGTSTGVNGSFSIEANAGDVIEFTIVGYQGKTVNIGQQTEVNVALELEALGLSDVVVVGYGTAQKRDLTGAIKSIKMTDLPPETNGNLMQSLRGYAAGLNVTGGGSLSGDEPAFDVRGRTSLSASDAPLVVLDGIIFQGSINDINIGDIDKIDILKDASAAAVFGSRSANGVILITTKKGSGNKTRINFSSYFGLQNFSNNPVKMMNGEQYATRLLDYDYEMALYAWYAKKPTSPTDQGGRPVRPNVSDPNVVTPYLVSTEEVENYLAGKEVDWTDVVTRTAPIQNFDLSLSGSTNRSSYFISGSYVNQKGILINDQFKRLTLTTKVDTKVTDWFTLGLNTAYSNRDQSGLPVTMEYARNATPLGSIYDSAGNYPVWYNGEFLMRHPLRNTLVDNKNIINNLFVTAFAKIEVPQIKGLVYDFNYSNNTNTSGNNTFTPSTIYEGQGTKGLATVANSKTTSWIMNNILSYSGRFAADHRVNATALYSSEQRKGFNSSANTQQFQNELLGYNNLGFGSLASVESSAWLESSVSYMARLNYIYRDRYMITGTIRKDGFSGFGANKKYATFPSLSVAWVASEEAFMQNTKDWLNQLKLRVSYGENGNQGIGRYASLSRMGVNGYVFGASPAIGIVPTTLGNSSLGWESTKSLNFGLDYSILNSRISGTIDIYSAQTSDVLVRRSLPGATGYTNVWTNIGGISNKGIELEISTINLEGAFRWESRFVFALNRDKITDLYGDKKDDLGNSWFIGKPISSIYDYQRAGGVWTEDELYKGQIVKGFYPGQFRLTDFDGDGQITAGSDRTIVGYGTPNYRFSISNSLSFKNFTLSFLLNSIQGGNGYYIQRNNYFLEATTDFNYAQRMNQPAVRTNWLPDNGVTNAPGVYNQPLILSGNYQDRSFVRLQDLSLVYNFQQSALNALKLGGLQLYLSGKNLHVWTNWEGYDPEVGGSALPLMRSVAFGLKVNL